MEEYVLGVDIGTGSTKAVAVDREGAILGAASRLYVRSHPEPGASEQEPEDIWLAFLQSVKEAIELVGRPPQMISLSSAMHSLILADPEGTPLMPLMTWADVRSAAVAEELQGTETGKRLYRNTGTPIHPMSPLCKLIWLRREKPELFGAAARFLSIKDYIWFKLFGHFEADYSVASASGLFDLASLCWNEEALRLTEIQATQLPDLKNTDFVRDLSDATLLSRLGLDQPVPVMIGASDGCSANLGTYVHGRGKAALTIGTSGAVRVTGRAPISDDETMIFNYRLDEQTYVSGGAVNNGGNTVDWLLKKFLNVEQVGDAAYKDLFDAIDHVEPGSEGLLFLPYLHGERAPIWEASASGAFLNIRSLHTQAHFFRAGLEGVCLALNDVLKTIEERSGAIEALHVSGGFTNSDVWMQLLADVTGKRLLLMQVEDASAVGTAYLAIRKVWPEAFVRLGERKADRVIEPNDVRHRVYQQVFGRYRKSYHLLKTIWA
ncbi:gluconokinase [Pedobacter faecalis]|uniref:gluconokinase n=1 Tax=Pedobacter faecalis TaxID=3041495 RepID=UPI00254A98BE|nr:gluconokinase [Pedobacter sp. ELA7]